MDALATHRLQFAFTAAYHYLYPQLTMGLALLVVVLKLLSLARGDAVANEAARFWTRILGLAFVAGVVTGIPLEFQLGTDWARLSERAGAVIGQTLAMEGVFAFFLESAFLYLLLFQEERLGPRGHLAAAVAVLVGSWLSAYFIIATNAFLQHPVGHDVAADGSIRLVDLGAYLTNPWALAQLAHALCGTVLTASLTVASISSLYLLEGRCLEHARVSLRVAVIAGLIAALAAAFPTGDARAKLVARDQPVTFAAMEGHFESARGAGLVILGQPDMERLELDNPLVLPRVLSFLTHARWTAFVEGLKSFPRELWPDQVPLLYYAYHVMAGLGTIFIALLAAAAALLPRGRLFRTRWMLWALLLALPFPYIANTAGWLTSELGRQPWAIHGLLRTAEASSEGVSSGNVLFTLLGFMGLYALLSALVLLLGARIVLAGPGAESGGHGG